MSTFVIAEAGVNHNGDESLAIGLVEAAAASGADAVKFQTFSADRLTRRGAKKASYQEASSSGGDQYEMLKALELPHDAHRRLYERCADLNIEFMSTAFDHDSLDFLIELGIRRIKVPSGEITNDQFLRHVASKNLPLIVSTGMSTLDEVKQAVDVISAERTKCSFDTRLNEVVTLLHCTSNYPAEAADVNLLAMSTMQREIRLPVGYSDHTLGLAVSTGAVALGATIIEKHFTLDRTLSGPDHRASLEPDQLTELIRQIRDIEVALGSNVKAPADSELPVRDVARRSVTAIRNVAKGATFSADDLELLRPGNGIAPVDLSKVIGCRAARDISANETLQWSDLA